MPSFSSSSIARRVASTASWLAIRMSSYALARSLGDVEDAIVSSSAAEAISIDANACPIAASTTFAVRPRHVIWESDPPLASFHDAPWPDVRVEAAFSSSKAAESNCCTASTSFASSLGKYLMATAGTPTVRGMRLWYAA